MERTVVGEPGVVDQLINRGLVGGKLVVKFGCCTGGGKIEDDWFYGDVVSLLESGGDFSEGVLGSGDEDQGVGVLGVDFGEGESDASRCAGDEGGGFCHVLRLWLDSLTVRILDIEPRVLAVCC